MKAKSLLATLLMAVLFAGCYKDDIDDLQNNVDNITNRLETLEQWMNETNTNIASLQTIVTALEKKDYVTEVTPLADNAGYEINFSQSGKITIYNGKNGTDGYTPEITIKKDKDGNYCWTLDGEFMTDADGKNISAMGLMPQLKIEADYWHISYDGKTWTKLGKAKGEDGEDGKDGANGWGGTGATGPKGDSFFEDVVVTETAVTFILSDAEGGEEFTLPIGAISFASPGTSASLVLNSGTATTTLLVNTPADYQTLVVKVESPDAVLTKAEGWTATITGDAADKTKATVTITGTSATATSKALVTLTLIDKNDLSYSISKLVTVGVDLSAESYEIGTAEVLQEVVKAMSKDNSLLSKNITLTADIDLTNAPMIFDDGKSNWKAIGTYENQYTGTFNGNDKTITSLVINSTAKDQGLIGALGSGGKVQNVTLEDCSVTSTINNVGGIVGYNNSGSTGEVSGCKLIGGTVASTFTHDKTASSVGGIVGSNAKNATVTSCEVSGAVTVTSSGAVVGGIAGNNLGTVEECDVTASSSANITITAGNQTVGGIAGQNRGGSITSCMLKNEGNGTISVKATTQYIVGGIVGCNEVGEGDASRIGTVTGCSVLNNGSGKIEIVANTMIVGGIAGQNTSKLSGCKVINSKEDKAGITITAGGATAGGIVGVSNNSVDGCEAVNCTVSGTHYVGGILGGNISNGLVTACYAKGMSVTMTGGSGSVANSVGGIVGANGKDIKGCYAYQTSINGFTASGTETADVVGVNSYTASGNTSIGTITQCYYVVKNGSSLTNYDGTAAADWATAADAMNTAINSSSVTDKYTWGGTASAPTLTKQ